MGSRLEKKSNLVRKRIENHNFDDEDGDEYGASAFGGFPEYFRRKKIKLQNLDQAIREQAGDKPKIFKGIVATANGYTQPSFNDLHKMLVEYGGGWVQYMDGKTMVTHIIASSLTPKKAIEFRRYRIVKPAWVVDSIKAGKLLPWESYRVLDEGIKQKTLGFEQGKVINQASTQSKGYREMTDKSWYTDQFNAQQTQSSSSQRPPLSSSRKRTVSDDSLRSPPTSPPNPISPRSPWKTADDPDPPGFTTPRKETVQTNEETPQIVRDIRRMAEDGLLGGDTEEDTPPDTPTKSRIIHRPPNAVDQATDLEKQPSIYDAALPFDGIPEGLEQDFLNEDMSFIGRQSANRLVEQESTEEDATDSETVSQEPPSSQPENIPQNFEEHYHMMQKGKSGPGVEDDVRRAKMTAEDHNAELLADPRIRKSTVVNPEFLEQYYRESRLHHLSAWKADLKSQMQALAEEKTATQKARQKRPTGARRYIMHVDFDCFFAAVSLLKAPHLKDKAVAVAHGGGSGSEIASCNYVARKHGIKNGMWMKRAQELFSDLKVLPYDFPAYEDASRAFYEAIISTGGLVQSVSVDEALVDISMLCIEGNGSDGFKRHEGSVTREQKAADKVAERVRADIKQRTGCDVSIGLGSNILQAKVALRKAKPAGQYQLRPEEVLDFIGELEVQSLPGVAFSLGTKLEDLGVKYVKDIRGLSKERLVNSLGPKTGEKLWEYARGIDRKEVGDVEVRKSVSAEVNWGVRFVTQDQVDEFISNLCGELCKRLARERAKGRHLSLKIMRRAADAPLDPPKHLGHGKCDTFNKSVSLGVATNDHDIITKEILSILRSFGFTPGEFRGIGVQMQQLEPVKAAGKPESSQRRLGFAKMDAAAAAAQKARAVSPPNDPIEEFTTPQKPRNFVDYGADQLKQLTPSKKPLNILGTQFIIPSQVDPSVLAELPADIRAKLAKHISSRAAPVPRGGSVRAEQIGETSIAGPLFPPQSQIDPEILKTLPKDIRDELLAFYNTSMTKRHTGDQSILPQSPRKNRVIAPPKRLQPAPVRRRGRPGKFEVQSARNNSSLTQANFVVSRMGRGRSNTPTTDTDAEANEANESGVDRKASAKQTDEVDQDFLDALPDDIRREVLAEQRRQRMQKTAGLDVNTNRRRLPVKATGSKFITRDTAAKAAPAIKRLLRLPARPTKPTFTAMQFSELPDLRSALENWVDEFREDGPYAEDTDALVKYLTKVVKDEKDMAKAVSVVKWMTWLLDDQDLLAQTNTRDLDAFAGTLSSTKKEEGWAVALLTLQTAVQEAVRDRGLGKVTF